MVSEIYRRLIPDRNLDELGDCAILLAINIDVDEINDKVLNLINESTKKKFTSIDTLLDDDKNK